MKVSRTGLVVIALLDLAAFVGGLAGNLWLDLGRWPIAVCLGAIGIVTFMGLLVSGNAGSGVFTVDDKEMRIAIASTFVVIEVSQFAIFSLSDYNPANGSLAREVVSNFSTLFTVVVGFYFG